MYRYFVASLHEFSRIRWLSLRRALVLSVVVLVFGVISGFLLGMLDRGFATLLQGIVV